MYDGGSFSEYPMRQGYNKEQLLAGNFSDRTQAEVASFLQSWLYFGFLHEVFGTADSAYDPTDFIRITEAGEWVVTTQKLPLYLRQWKIRETSQLKLKLQLRAVALSKCLAAIRPFSLRFCDVTRYVDFDAYPVPDFWLLTPEVSLSILVLYETVCYTFGLVFRTYLSIFNRPWGESCIVKTRLLEDMLAAQDAYYPQGAMDLGTPKPAAYRDVS